MKSPFGLSDTDFSSESVKGAQVSAWIQLRMRRTESHLLERPPPTLSLLHGQPAPSTAKLSHFCRRRSCIHLRGRLCETNSSKTHKVSIGLISFKTNINLQSMFSIPAGRAECYALPQPQRQLWNPSALPSLMGVTSFYSETAIAS